MFKFYFAWSWYKYYNADKELPMIFQISDVIISNGGIKKPYRNMNLFTLKF